MRDCNALLRLVRVLKTALAVFIWTGGGAAVGVAAMGLFGTLCGTLDGIVHFDTGRILPIALYSTLCGAAAGAIVGGVGRVIDPEGAGDLFRRSPKGSSVAGDSFQNSSTVRDSDDLGSCKP
jgi:hypothetical protein